MNHVTRTEKEELVRESKVTGITLNGNPAKLTEIKTKSPVVTPIAEEFLPVEWTGNWKAIRDIITNNNGEFTVKDI
jgi:hypothetical protein